MPGPTLRYGDRAFIEGLARALGVEVQALLPQLGGGADAIRDGALVRLFVPQAPGELDLRGLDALEKVQLGGEGLTGVRLGDHPKLASLDLAGARLSTIDLAGASGLTHLDVGFNRFTRLDVSGLRSLAVLWCQGNGLVELRLPEGAPLTRLAISRNAIRGFDARAYPALTMLLVDELGLTELPLAHPALTHLSCKGNLLARLDVSGAPALHRLDADGNPLAAIDLRGLARLRQVSLPAATEVACTTLQRHAIAGLRARFGLPTGTTALARMDPYELHLFAQDHNWDDGVGKLFDVIRHPRCDLATALLVYWNGLPEELAGWRTATEAPRAERRTVELLREIEDRVARGAYRTRLIPFDVHDVGGVDLSSDDARIPDAMRTPVVADDDEAATPAKSRKPAAKAAKAAKSARP